MRCTLAALLLPGLLLGCASDDDDRPASWSYIHEAIIRPNCATASCHSGENQVAGLALHSKESAYSAFVGAPCTDDTPDFGVYVTPGSRNINESRLSLLLRGSDLEEFVMPPDRLMPLADVALIDAWIAGGALCD